MKTSNFENFERRVDRHFKAVRNFAIFGAVAASCSVLLIVWASLHFVVKCL